MCKACDLLGGKLLKVNNMVFKMHSSSSSSSQALTAGSNGYSLIYKKKKNWLTSSNLVSYTLYTSVMFTAIKKIFKHDLASILNNLHAS